MEQRIIRNKEHWVVDEDGNVLGFDHGTRTQYLATVETNPLTGVIELLANGNLLPKLKPKANFLRVASNLTNWSLGNSGTAASATVDVASPFGVPAVRLDIPNGNTYAQLTSTGLSVPGYATAAGNLTWIIYAEDAALISQAQSIIGDSGFAASDTLTYNIANSDKHNHSGVHFIGHNKVVTPTVVDVRIRISGTSVGAGQTGRVWVLGCYIPEPVKPCVVLTFDDADITFHSKILPALRARNLHATFGINKDQVGTNDTLYINEGHLAEIYAAGNDLSSHNLTNTTVLSQGLSAYLADFDACAAWLQGKGWVRGKEYHPFVQGKHTGPLFDALASRGVKFQRCATTSAELMPVGTSDYARSVLMPIARPLSSSSSLVNAKASIDDAITYGQDCVFMGHVIGAVADTVTWVEADFLALLDYACLKQSQGQLALVGSVTEWARLRGYSVGA